MATDVTRDFTAAGRMADVDRVGEAELGELLPDEHFDVRGVGAALAAERSRANTAAVARHEAVAEVDLDQRDMLRLATLGGASVWQLDDQVGSLSVGKQADLAVIDMRGPHLDGFGDPVTTMVMGAGPADVETVIVAGEVVKARGVLAGPFAEHARDLMHESRASLRARLDISVHS